jgi:hypothetical protein
MFIEGRLIDTQKIITMNKKNPKGSKLSGDQSITNFPADLLWVDAGPYPSLNKQPKWWEKILETLRHPFVLLVLGTMISTLIVPFIVTKSNQKRLLAEARVKKALEIVDKNSLFERQLYSLFSRLGLFHQQNIVMKPNPEDLKKLKDELRKDMDKKYIEDMKDYSAEYIWIDDLYKQAIILEILPRDDSDKVRNSNAPVTPQAQSSPPPQDLRPLLVINIENYKDNVADSMGALREFWNRCLSDEYDFDPNGNTSKIQLDTTRQLNNLFSERTKIVDKLVEEFTPQ